LQFLFVNCFSLSTPKLFGIFYGVYTTDTAKYPQRNVFTFNHDSSSEFFRLYRKPFHLLMSEIDLCRVLVSRGLLDILVRG